MSKAEWGKPFPIKSLTREDLVVHGFPRWQAASITDEEMCQIASEMGVSYTQSFFLQDLESAVTFVLGKRTGTNIIGEPE